MQNEKPVLLLKSFVKKKILSPVPDLYMPVIDELAGAVKPIAILEIKKCSDL